MTASAPADSEPLEDGRRYITRRSRRFELLDVDAQGHETVIDVFRFDEWGGSYEAFSAAYKLLNREERIAMLARRGDL